MVKTWDDFIGNDKIWISQAEYRTEIDNWEILTMSADFLVDISQTCS